MADTERFILELVDKMSGPAKNAKASMGGLDKQMKGVDTSSMKASGSMGEAGASAEGLGGSLGGALAGGAVIAAAALTALTVAGGALAIHAHEQKEDTLDMLGAMMGTEEAATSTYDAIEGMSDHVAISLDRGAELARQLTAAGLTTQDELLAAIKAIGEVDSVIGKEAGGKIQALIEKSEATGKFKLNAKALGGTGVQEAALVAEIAKATGKGQAQIKAALKAGTIDAAVGIAAISKVIDAKFGGVAEKQVRDFGNQMVAFKDNIMKIFEDVNTTPFLDALHDVLNLFSQNTQSGKAMKYLMTTVFDGLSKAAKVVAPYVMAFLKGMVIAALKVWIALKPLRDQLTKIFGGDQKSNMDDFVMGLDMISDGIAGIVTAVVPLAQALLSILIPVAKISFAMISGAMAILGGIGEVLGGIFTAIGDTLEEWYTAGTQLIGGLWEGIKSGAGALWDGLKNIGKKALQGFKDTFGISSPSKVMMGMGGHLMKGLEMGIAANDGGPTGAMSAAVPSPTGDAAPAQSSGGGGSGGGISITIAAGAIVINGVANAEQIKDVLPGQLAAVFEGLAIELGGQVGGDKAA